MSRAPATRTGTAPSSCSARTCAAPEHGRRQMAVETKQFGPHNQITAHFLTQVGSVSRSTTGPSDEQSKQAAAVGRLYADFVRKATFSLHIAIYDFRLTGDAGRDFIEALNERAKAGVDVRIAYHHAK